MHPCCAGQHGLRGHTEVSQSCALLMRWVGSWTHDKKVPVRLFSGSPMGVMWVAHAPTVLRLPKLAAQSEHFSPCLPPLSYAYKPVTHLTLGSVFIVVLTVGPTCGSEDLILEDFSSGTYQWNYSFCLFSFFSPFGIVTCWCVCVLIS